MGRATQKAMLKSWHEDKAVQDQIVESWLCIACGMNTHPGTLSGPEMRIAFALGEEAVEFTFDKNCEVYSVKDAVWKQAGMRPWSGCLCIGCLEERLGRQLRPKDFSRHDREVWAKMPSTDRLLDRRGFRQIRVRTKHGQKEVIVAKEDAGMLAKMIPAGELPYLEDEEGEGELVAPASD